MVGYVRCAREVVDDVGSMSSRWNCELPLTQYKCEMVYLALMTLALKEGPRKFCSIVYVGQRKNAVRISHLNI